MLRILYSVNTRPPRPTRVWLYTPGPVDVSRTSNTQRPISGSAGTRRSSAAAASNAGLTHPTDTGGADTGGRACAGRIDTIGVRSAGFRVAATADGRVVRSVIDAVLRSG